MLIAGNKSIDLNRQVEKLRSKHDALSQENQSLADRNAKSAIALNEKDIKLNRVQKEATLKEDQLSKKIEQLTEE